MEALSNQLGYLLMDEDGAVLSSSGECENDEKVAAIIVKMLRVASKSELGVKEGQEGFHRLTINYSDHCYIVCVSNKRIHVVKRQLSALSDSA